MRLFVADASGWSELTDGGPSAVRVDAADLQRARRARAHIRASEPDVAVILDVTVAIAPDFRSARTDLVPVDGVHYAGTVDGLAGLLADIESAGVADGVTLLPVSARQDARVLGRDVLDRLAARRQPRAS